MHKAIALIALPLSVLVSLEYFGVYSINAVLPLSIYIIGSLYLIAMQIIGYIAVHTANQGTLLMGKIIKTVLAIPGILYLINLAIPLTLPIDLEILIAAFLFTEGIYALH